MAWIDSAVDGLFGAIATGGLALGGSWWVRRSRRPQYEDAWKAQSDELLATSRHQFEGEIRWLRQDNARKEAEIRRLNIELNRQRRGGADD